MSTVLSSAKSRVKGALLAAAAVAALAPAVSQATLSVDLRLDATGTTLTKNITSATATTPIPVYVYATVTGTTAPNGTTSFDGLQFLYYNILSSATTAVPGGVTAATLNAPFAGNGSQAGGLNPAAGVVLGSTTTLTSVAKPRSTAATFNTSGTSPNVVISGNSASFLVETLTFTPTSFTSGAKTTLTASIPASLIAAGQYAQANWFQDNTVLPATGAQPQATSSNFTGGVYQVGTSVILVDQSATGLQGDLNHDGTVNIADFNILASHFGQSTTNPDFGDINGDGSVNIADFNILASNFGKSGAAGAADFAPLAQFAGANGDAAGFAAAVPEPTSLALLGTAAALLVGRRRKVSVAN